MSHEQYMDEPAEVVDWLLALAQMEGEMQEAKVKRAQEQARARHGR